MTGPEMNAAGQKIAVVSAALMVAVSLTACAGAFNPRTDPTSPVAPRVQALVDANRAYPRWSNVPKRSEPAVEPTAIASRVGALNTAGGTLAQDVARIDWTVTEDPAVFAAGVQARVDAVQVAPVTAETQAEIDAFARRARERGRAPPPVDRR